jgi:hypothetical protein
MAMAASQVEGILMTSCVTAQYAVYQCYPAYIHHADMNVMSELHPHNHSVYAGTTVWVLSTVDLQARQSSFNS